VYYVLRVASFSPCKCVPLPPIVANFRRSRLPAGSDGAPATRTLDLVVDELSRYTFGTGSTTPDSESVAAALAQLLTHAEGLAEAVSPPRPRRVSDGEDDSGAGGVGVGVSVLSVVSLEGDKLRKMGDQLAKHSGQVLLSYRALP